MAQGFDYVIMGELNGHESLDEYNRLPWMLAVGIECALFKPGPAISNVVEGRAFWYADMHRTIPDLQFHFLCGAGAEARARLRCARPIRRRCRSWIRTLWPSPMTFGSGWRA